MDFIKQWALGLVAAAVAGTAVLLLTPKGVTEKQVKTAVSLFLLVAFIYPFVSDVDFTEVFSFNGIKTAEFDENGTSKILEKSLESEMEMKFEKHLREKGINFRDINIDITVKENNEISVDRIVVTSEDDNSEEIKSALKEEYGTVAEVEVQE